VNQEVEMAQQVLEGTWEEISRCGDQLAGHRVRLIVLDPVRHDGQEKGAMLSHGMFPQIRSLTDADLDTAGFRGDPDDDLDWS
jgi:hypothetical protein